MRADATQKFEDWPRSISVKKVTVTSCVFIESTQIAERSCRRWSGESGASTVSFVGAVKKWVREEGSTIQKKTVGTCIRRLVIRTSVSLARSLGSSVLAYRKVCQKGAGRAGV